MKISRMLIISMCILLVCLPQICAIVDIKIDVDSEFSTGDTISFNYTIDSDIEQTISYMEIVDCPSAPHAFLDEKTALVSLTTKVQGKYTYLKVTDDIKFQECTASIVILEPNQQTSSKAFTINTNPSFDFDVILDKKVFVKGEEINLDYQSEINNPVIEASLTYPDKSTLGISLPYSFEAEKIGAYELNVVASKQGYKTISVREQFGVIKENANIEYTNLAEGFAVQEKTNLFERAREGDLIDKIIIVLICILVSFVVLVIVFELIKKFKSRER